MSGIIHSLSSLFSGSRIHISQSQNLSGVGHFGSSSSLYIFRLRILQKKGTQCVRIAAHLNYFKRDRMIVLPISQVWTSRQLSIGRRFVHASVVTCCLTELLVIGQLKVTIIHRFAQSKGHNYSIRCWLEQGLITFCPILKLSHSFRWLGRYGRYTGVYAPMYPFLDAPSRLCSCRKSRVELSSY